MRLGGLLALITALVLAVAGMASARRPATSPERALIGAAVLRWEQQDEAGQTERSMVSASQWRAKLRCHNQKVYVSTVNARWAVYWLESKYLGPNIESDPRYQKCRRDAGYVEGAWVLKRSASGSWAPTGWIYGERSGYCRAISATGIPLKVFRDAHGGLPFTC